MASRTQALLVSLARRFGQKIKGTVLAVQEYAQLSARALAGVFTRPRYPR